MSKDKTVSKPSGRVSDYVTKRQEVDKQIKIDDIIDQEVSIKSIDVLNGQTGEYLFISLYQEGEKDLFGFSCGGKVVVRKLKEVKDKNGFPCLATFRKVKNYFDVE